MATACTAPTINADAYSTFTYPLEWEDAAGGTSNSITGYEIQIRVWDYTENTWGSYKAYKVVSSTKTYGSLDVTVSQVKGGIYQIRIRTRGSAGSAYYSDWTTTGVVRVYNDCAAPSTVTIGNFTNTNKATISWSDPTATGNCPIAGYAVYRSVNGGAYSVLNTSWLPHIRTLTVDVPADSSNTYTFRVKSLSGTGNYAGFDSPLSTAVATSQDKYGKCGAPINLNVTPHLTYHLGIALLTWDAGTAGTENPITGYTVWRQLNGAGSYAQYGAKTAELQMFVTAPSSDGFYNYRVITVGTAPGKNSDMSNADVLWAQERSSFMPDGGTGKTNAVI